MEKPNGAIYWSVQIIQMINIGNWSDRDRRCLVLSTAFLAKSFPSSIAYGTSDSSFHRIVTDWSRPSYPCSRPLVLRYRLYIDHGPSGVPYNFQTWGWIAGRFEFAFEGIGYAAVGGWWSGCIENAA